MKIFPTIGLQAPTILLPNTSVDLHRWAVVACDQYTSEPDYWEAVEVLVGKEPSTYRMILPEAYLGTDKEQRHADQVFPTMNKYIDTNVFQEIDGFVLVERTFGNITRTGLVAALDLEAYDYNRDSQSQIRATEGTIVDRLPPRIAIREKAPLEIPHILVLIDDPNMTVIEPIAEKLKSEPSLYDFSLMQEGGHIKGKLVDEKLYPAIEKALEELNAAETQQEKYQTAMDAPPLLYAMGDGNHSLATAKAIWEKNRANLPENHPSRFALVEIVNLHDPSIEFEAIHRLIKNGSFNLIESIKTYFKNEVSVTSFENFEDLSNRIDRNLSEKVVFGLFLNDEYFCVEITKPVHTLPVGNVQIWLDRLLQEGSIEGIDYIHGRDTIHSLGTQKGHAGIYLPAMAKDALFKSVIKDGPLPRKTFSMGEAHQKRFYLECRKIK